MRTLLFSMVLGAGCAAAGLGCNGNTSASRSDDHAPAVSTSSVVVRPAVAWPQPAALDDGALAALVRSSSKSESDLRALIARSPVPVLGPRDLELASPTLVVEGEYFALTGRASGATVSLQGTRAAHRYENIEPANGNRALARSGGATARGFVSVNEGIRTASWIENGAAYSVDVECSDARDTRCQSDDFLLSIVAQLGYVGGSGR